MNLKFPSPRGYYTKLRVYIRNPRFYSEVSVTSASVFCPHLLCFTPFLRFRLSYFKSFISDLRRRQSSLSSRSWDTVRLDFSCKYISFFIYRAAKIATSACFFFFLSLLFRFSYISLSPLFKYKIPRPSTSKGLGASFFPEPMILHEEWACPSPIAVHEYTCPGTCSA